VSFERGTGVVAKEHVSGKLKDRGEDGTVDQLFSGVKKLSP